MTLDALLLLTPPMMTDLLSQPSIRKKPVGFRQRGRKIRGIAFGRRRDSYEYWREGQVVDEQMIVLRKRIHEMKMVERNYEPPAEWMEWEKELYAGYDELICRGVGLLQVQLMNCRPSVGVGLVALISLSVPAMTFVVLIRMMEMANGVFSSLHF